MAALASTAVQLATTDGASAWYTRGKDNRNVVTRKLLIALTGQGGAANTIGAAALGFSKLIDCSSLFDSQNALIYDAVIHPSLNAIVLANVGTGALVDVTSANAYITVTGIPL